MNQTTRQDVIISGRHILRQYNELRAQGYTRVWTGEGKICMRPPEVAESRAEVAQGKSGQGEQRAKEQGQ